ncbi:MAG: ATP-binding cassette domain-containing protein, partial [Limibacillus sp.]
MEVLALKSVHHWYGDIHAVDDLSIAVEAGEVVCLLGPSGCGKTTALRVAAGLETLQEGEVRLGGKVVADGRRDMAPEDRNVGLVFQDYALFPHLTVEANVGFGLTRFSS